MKVETTTGLHALISTLEDGPKKQELVNAVRELDKIRTEIETSITDYNYKGETTATWIVLVFLILFFTAPLWIGKIKRFFGGRDDDELFGISTPAKRELVIYS